MPTSLPRTWITHTSEVQHALEVAEKRWPGQRPNSLLLHLIEEGARIVETTNTETVAARRAEIERISAGFTGVYQPGDLEELREGWPE